MLARARDAALRIPPLLRFLGLHMLYGIGMGLLLATGFIATNTAGLRDLLAGAEEPAVALLLLYVFNALTLGSIAMGIGVMTLPMDQPCDMRERGRQND